MTSRGAWAAAVRRLGPVRLAAIPVLVVLASVIAAAPAWNARLPAAWFDFCQMLSPRKIVSMPATIVEIDHKSLAALGQWPWPRFVLAQLVVLALSTCFAFIEPGEQALLERFGADRGVIGPGMKL